jgi:transposase
MVTVDEYRRIRIASRDGMSIRELARTFHHSRRKIREILAKPEPQPYTRSRPLAAPVLGAFHGVIDAILVEDEQAPRKQRHTAMQVYRRLCSEQGYTGGYDQVRRYIGKQRRRQRETFIPLSHDPGQRLEADFGHIYVDFPEGRRQIPVLLLVWSYSNCPFALAVPSERVEAILTGMVEGFAFFGCVAREVWWDNPKTVVEQIYAGRERRLHERYAALASHYTFEPLCCLPRRGNEKPYVENRVYTLQRQWCTPVPRVADWAELNERLRARCLEERQRPAPGGEQTIGERFEQERVRALALPRYAFDPCVLQAAKVDKYQTVHFQCNRYSVPRAWAFRSVTVKAYNERLEIVGEGQVIARHPRSYQRHEQLLDPLHYLDTLQRRPAALDHASVFGHWRLPASFSELRATLAQEHGSAAGARHYVRILQLLVDHPLARVQQAIDSCRPRSLNADGIIQATRCLAETSQRPLGESLPLASAELAAVQVPVPDLKIFNQFLDLGEPIDVQRSDPAFEKQFETVASARDECGV